MKMVEQIVEETGLSPHTVRHLARSYGMELTGGRYWFDEDMEARIKSRRTLDGEPQSARSIAKKYGCSPEKVAKWAKRNGIAKEKNSYYFTPEEEMRFSKEKDLPMVGRPPKPVDDTVQAPPRPRGRPRLNPLDHVVKLPGRRGRPRKGK